MIVPLQPLVEGLSTHKFHHDVRGARLRFLADIEDGHDSGMRKASGGFRFPNETLAIVAFLFQRLAGQGNRLYRDDPVDLGIAGLVDNAHGSSSQFGEDLVSPETFAPAIIHGGLFLAWGFAATYGPKAAYLSFDAVVTTTPTTFSFSTSRIFFACCSVIPFSNSSPILAPRKAEMTSWWV